MGGRFAGEVAGVEFLEGGVDVVDVEPDASDDPLFGIDLGEIKRFSLDRRDADSTEREALSAGRDSG